MSSISYTVVSGDTLSAIALALGTTVAEIADANNIADPNRINVGQTLNIPFDICAPDHDDVPDEDDSEQQIANSWIEELTGVADVKRAATAFENDDILEGLFYSGLAIVGVIGVVKIVKVASLSFRVSRIERGVVAAAKAKGVDGMYKGKNLTEQLVLESVKKRPVGEVIIKNLSDPRLPKGSMKLQYTYRNSEGKKVVIHWTRTKGKDYLFKVKHSDFAPQ